MSSIKAFLELPKHDSHRHKVEAFSRPVIRKLDEYIDPGKLLKDDAKHSYFLVETNERDQRALRNLVRTTWGAIEGTTFAMRQLCHTAAEMASIRLTVDQLHILDQPIFDVTPLGIKPIWKNLKTLDQIKDGLKTCDLILGDGKIFNLSRSNWNSVRKSFGVRNRLMHPKRSRDLEISDSELEITRDAFAWLLEVDTEFILRWQEGAGLDTTNDRRAYEEASGRAQGSKPRRHCQAASLLARM